jgi:hypothetical protein
VLVVLLAGGLGLLPLAQGQLVRIPRTSVTIAPPPGFKVARAFTGLENTANGSSIRISELPPEAYAELAAAFASPKTAASRFASQGIRITRVEQLAVRGSRVPFAIGGQRVDGKDIVKYMAVIGGPETGASTVWVVFDVADPSSFRRSDVETVLESITVGRAPTVDDEVARLPFEFRAVPPFRIADADESSVLLTASGAEPSGTKWEIVIERAATSARPMETPQLNEKIMRSLPDFGDAVVTEQGPAEFVGGQGHYLAAVGGDRTVLQFLRVLPNGRYVRLVARGETSALESAREAVAEIAASVTIPE